MSREALIEKLSAVFRHHGYDGASLARLSEATGLVKASLYYQFPRGKEDMAAAVIAALAADIGREVIEPLRDDLITPRARLDRMAQALDRVYAGGRLFCVIDVFGIGEAGRLYQDHLRRAILGITTAIAGVLREAGHPAPLAAHRAEDALIAVQGALVLSRATGDPAPFRRVLAELPDRLLSGAASIGAARSGGGAAGDPG